MEEKDFNDFFDFVKNTLNFKSEKSVIVYMITHPNIIQQMYDEFKGEEKFNANEMKKIALKQGINCINKGFL